MAKNVKRLHNQKDTGSDPKINAGKDNSASYVKPVTQGVKRKFFCSFEREYPEDANPCKNSDTREKTVQTSEETFQTTQRRLKKYSKDNKISECFLYSLGGPATIRKLVVSNPYNWHGLA